VNVDTTLVADGTFMEDTMRHPVTTLLSALVFVTAIVPISSVQAQSDSTTQVQRMLPTNRWVTTPTPIKLTADQQKKLDSISAKYAAEEQHVRTQGKGQSNVVMMYKMLALTGKYQNMVWTILNPTQKAVFDKNIRAPVFGP
jgi:hypothetical protein